MSLFFFKFYSQNSAPLYLDPLTLPPRREQCLRKAKTNSIAIMGNTSTVPPADDVMAEPDEFADSDTDPVWTPQEEDVSLIIIMAYLCVVNNYTYIFFVCLKE